MDRIVVIKDNIVIDKILVDVNNIELINQIIENREADSYFAVSEDSAISVGWHKEDDIWKAPNIYIGWIWDNSTESWKPPFPKPSKNKAWIWDNSTINWVDPDII